MERRRLAWVAIGLLLLTACSGSAMPAITPSAQVESPTLVVAPASAAATRIPGQPIAATATPFRSTPVAVTAALVAATSTDSARSHPQMTVLAGNLAEPDDLLLAPDGSILVSDVADGTIKRLTPSGQITVVVGGLSEPEGMVLLPNGSLVIAEQGRNRLVRFDPRSNTLTPFLNLRNRTGQLGVDSIALDGHSPGQATIIIPDSPNGSVLRANLNASSVTTVARGLMRPTGAWVENDGSILVVDENAGMLERLSTSGNSEVLARLPIPDDVIEDTSGDIFVSTLGDGSVHVISSTTKHDTILATGFASPQGIIFDARGNLVVADSGHHQLLSIVLH